MRIEDDALALRRISFGDASWIVFLLTPHHGMVSAVARGVRRGRGEVRAALTGLHGLQVEIRARGSEAMGTLAHVEIVRARNRLPFMPIAVAGAQLIGEVVYRFVMPQDAQQGEVHWVLESALDALEAGLAPLVVVGGTIVHLLRLFGYGWRVESCVGCGKVASLSYFSIRRGGMVCAVCGGPYAHRLLVVGENLRQFMAGQAWPPESGRLSEVELSTLYQVGVASLELNGGRSLMADLPFRRLAGVVSGSGVLSLMKGTQNDRQGFVGDFGLSPMQGDVGIRCQGWGIDLPG
ncbi:MAG: DNA repair protein RecO [Magnetococcus sp. YQC-5]